MQCNGFLGKIFCTIKIFIINYQKLRPQTEYVLFLMLSFFQIRANSIYLQNDLRKRVSPNLEGEKYSCYLYPLIFVFAGKQLKGNLKILKKKHKNNT